MESQFKLFYNGQEIQQTDVNLLGEVAGLADDRVLAELFRLPRYDGTTVAKGIIPTTLGPARSTVLDRLVATNGATGKVLVNPFRAVVGSRTLSTADGKKNLRDIRSSIFVNTGASVGTEVSFTAPSASNFRVDLIYAAVAVDVDDSSVSRKVKDPTSGVVSTSSVSVVTKTTVTIAVAQGTQSTTNPTLPTLPTDAAGVYYIPIAYVRLRASYSGTTTFKTADIAVTAPLLSLSPSTGGTSSSVAEGNRSITSVTTAWKTFTNTTYGGPFTAFTGPETGAETLWVCIDDTFANGSYVDTRLFTQRYYVCRVACAAAIGTPQFAHNIDALLNPQVPIISQASNTWFTEMGHTFMYDESVPSGRTVFQVNATNAAGIFSGGNAISLVVDTGGLKVVRTGTTAGVLIVAKIDFSGMFQHCGNA